MGSIIRVRGSQRKDQSYLLLDVLVKAHGLCDNRILFSENPNLPTDSLFEHEPILLDAYRVLDAIQDSTPQSGFDYE